MNRWLRSAQLRATSAALLVAGGVVAAGWLLQGPVHSTTADARNPVAVDETALAHASALSHAFRSAADRALPAVVSIESKAQVRKVAAAKPGVQGERRRPLPPGFEELDPFFKKFFDELPESQQPFENPRAPRASSSGSGVIIDPAGVVLTNNHVVAGGGTITVRLHDGREFEAAEVKTDPATDLAIVRLKNARDLPSAPLGDSDSLRIGDWVLALGQPFGLADTVTAGIISAKNRGIGITRHEEFLQTDAAINPGNSGGPLVNLRGEVVGINTAISSTTGGYQGIGFAVPVNVAKWVSSQLISEGKVHRAFLGVGIQQVDQTLATQLGLASPTGALVTEVHPNSPAADAGLQPRDVILQFGNTPVENQRQLSALVGRSPIGSKQPLTVLRDGKRMTLQVAVREMPANFGARANRDVEDASPRNATSFDELGLELAPLTQDLADQLNLKEESGLVITDVQDGSPADAAGLAPSQVITQVGRRQVRTVEEFRAALKETSLDKGVLLLVKSAEGSRFVVLKQS